MTGMLWRRAVACALLAAARAASKGDAVVYGQRPSVPSGPWSGWVEPHGAWRGGSALNGR